MPASPADAYADEENAAYLETFQDTRTFQDAELLGKAECLESRAADPAPMDFSHEDEEDADSGDEINRDESQKTLELSVNRLKSHAPEVGFSDAQADIQHRWRLLVEHFDTPLCAMMSRARVDAFTSSQLDVVLPLSFKGLISQSHICEMESLLRKMTGRTCRVSVAYETLSDATETLAAQQARELLTAQAQAVEAVRETPIFKEICRIFSVDVDAVRFTFNNSRTSS